MLFLECMEFFRNLSRDIDVPDGQVNQVNERLHRSESTGTVLHHADDSVDALGGGIGES